MTHSKQSADGRVWTDGGTHTKQASGREFVVVVFSIFFQVQPLGHSRETSFSTGFVCKLVVTTGCDGAPAGEVEGQGGRSWRVGVQRDNQR